MAKALQFHASRRWSKEGRKKRRWDGLCTPFRRSKRCEGRKEKGMECVPSK